MYSLQMSRHFHSIPSDTEAVGESWKTHRFRSKVCSKGSCVHGVESIFGDLNREHQRSDLCTDPGDAPIFPALESLYRRGWRGCNTIIYTARVTSAKHFLKNMME